MAVARFAFIAAILSCAALAAAEVVELTDADFSTKVSDGTPYFVKLYAPWCGHCKRLAPVWDELGDKLTAVTAGINIAKVDCTESKATCEQNGIRGYPTLKVFYDGVEQTSEDDKYKGSRNFESLQEFALKIAAKYAKESAS